LIADGYKTGDWPVGERHINFTGPTITEFLSDPIDDEMFLRADWLADDNPPLFLLSQEAPIILDLIQLYQHIRHKRFSLRLISSQMCSTTA
jgi:hypothetical protein